MLSTAAADADGDALLESLERPDSGELYTRFSSFLKLFADFIPLDSYANLAGGDAAACTANTRKPAKKKVIKKAAAKKNPPDIDGKSLRSLAKQFLPFICRALNVLPSLLRSPAKGGTLELYRARELLAVYSLSLDCIRCISPCLDAKPYSAYLQRGRLVSCLEAWGLYAEAEEEGVSILEALSSVLVPVTKSQGRYLPDPDAAGTSDVDIGTLAVEITVSLIGCAYKGGIRDESVYQRALALFQQLQPWLKIMDAKASKKYMSMLLNALYRCSLLLAEKATSVDADLVQNFCLTVLRECLNSSLVENFSSFARRICSTFATEWEGRYLFVFKTMELCLESISCVCSVALVNAANEFLEVVSYCAETFVTATRSTCIDAFNALYRKGIDFLEVLPPVATILILYATGLQYCSRTFLVGHPNNESTVALSLDDEKHLQHLNDSLSNLTRYFNILDFGNHVSFDNKMKNGHPKCRELVICKHLHGYPLQTNFLDALEFFCKALVDRVNTSWQKLFADNRDHSQIANINHVHDALLQYCDVILAAFRFPNSDQRERLRLSGRRGTFLQVIVASFRSSIAFGGNYEKDISFINYALSSDWIEGEECKFLISSFHNTGALLYNNGQLEQASVVLKLCYEATWSYIELLCRTFLKKSRCTHVNDGSKEMLIASIAESSAKIASLLEALHKCGANDIRDIVAKSLHKLCHVEETYAGINGSFALVKLWVKIMCRDNQALDETPILYSFLMTSSRTWSKKALGKIIEQELEAYRIREAKSPDLCLKMQLKIMALLLSDVYVTEDFCLRRSQLLIKKGRLHRLCGFGALTSCIECIAEAISLLRNISGSTAQANPLVYHQLALAYCLHAQCSQEDRQDFEVILHDVDCAINLWLSIDISTIGCADSSYDLLADNTLKLLCYIIDMLSLKGCMKFHFKIYKLLVSFCKLEDITTEECLVMLWSDKRLNHSLCLSPIDEIFISDVAKQFKIPVNSIDFWIHSLEGSASSQVCFLQDLFIYDSILTEERIHYPENSYASKITAAEVKRLASSLVSSAPVTNQSAFLASKLYYGLSERLFQGGKLYEALSYAREALRLRKIILARKFSYAFHVQSGKTTHACADKFHIEAVGSVITEVWPQFCEERKKKDYVLSPWNILRCYLESVLQVAGFYESSGNGDEAEYLLHIGKKISCLHRLPPFKIAFATLLGQLYRKKQVYDLAENELSNAKQFLADSDTAFSCKHCELVFEVAIDIQIGDLSRNIFDKNLHALFVNDVPDALNIYRSALHKIKNTGVAGSFGLCEIQQNGSMQVSKTHRRTTPLVCSICAPREASNVCCDLETELREHKNIPPNQSGRTQISTGVKRRSKNSSKTLSKQNLEIAEKPQKSSRKQSCFSNTANLRESRDTLCRESKSSSSCYLYTCESEIGKWNLQADFGCDKTCICSKTNCWRCLLVNVMEYGSLQTIAYLKFEGHRRRLLIRLLLNIARCLGSRPGSCEPHQIHEMLSFCISSLFIRSVSESDAVVSSSFIIALMTEEIAGDIMPIQRATILYHVGWFALKDSFSENCRNKGCFLSNIQMSTIVPWLLRAFILCREFPLLFRFKAACFHFFTFDNRRPFSIAYLF